MKLANEPDVSIFSNTDLGSFVACLRLQFAMAEIRGVGAYVMVGASKTQNPGRDSWVSGLL
jgi:hypothetical protein